MRNTDTHSHLFTRSGFKNMDKQLKSNNYLDHSNAKKPNNDLKSINKNQKHDNNENGGYRNINVNMNYDCRPILT